MKKIIYLIIISFISSCYLYEETEINCSSVSIPALTGWKSEKIKTGIRSIYKYKPYFVTEDIGFMICPDSILKSNDGGESWTKLKFGNKYTFNDISFINQNVGFVSALDTNKTSSLILTTLDSGKSWTKHPIIDNWKINNLYFFNENIGIGIFSKITTDKEEEQEFIAKSSDGGLSWNKLNGNILENSIIKKFSFSPNGFGYLLDNKGHIYLSEDFGNNWKETPNFLGNHINNLQFINRYLGFVLKNDTLFKTVDGGKIYKKSLNINSDFFNFFNFFSSKYGILFQTVCYENREEYYKSGQTKYQIGCGSFYITNDGGKTWEEGNNCSIPFTIKEFYILNKNTFYTINHRYPQLFKFTKL